MENLQIKDVGAIERLDIELPPHGGVVVLRGKNGTGKTTALSAAEALVRGDEKLTTRDNASGCGRVEGLGATLTLGSRATRSGKIVIDSLSGKLSFADLVNPPLRDPSAADRVRIKALIGIEGTAPTPDLFRRVLGDDLMQHIPPTTWAGADLLDVCLKAKRDMETKARAKEDEAKIHEGQACSASEQGMDLDLSAENNETVLRDASIAATSRLSVLQDRALAAQKTNSEIENAHAYLEKITREYQGLSAAEAERDYTQISQAFEVALRRKQEIERQLLDATISVETSQAKLLGAKGMLAAAHQHEKTISDCKGIVSGVYATPPTPTDIIAARENVSLASKAMEQGAVIRHALLGLRQATKFREQALKAASVGQQLRHAAGQLDNVLSEAIQTPYLSVRDGRLYATHPTRGVTLFHEFSEGERWTMAFDIIAPVVGEHGIIVLPQGAWESLDPDNRKHIGELAIERKLYVLTAEATAGELRAESFTEGTAP